LKFPIVIHGFIPNLIKEDVEGEKGAKTGEGKSDSKSQRRKLGRRRTFMMLNILHGRY